MQIASAKAKKQARRLRTDRKDAGAPTVISFDILIFRSYSPLKRLAIQTKSNANCELVTAI
jgi:hypothetical protein